MCRLVVMTIAEPAAIGCDIHHIAMHLMSDTTICRSRRLTLNQADHQATYDQERIIKLKKNTLIAAAFLTSSSIFVVAPAFALDCVKNDRLVTAYEGGVEAGRKDATKHKGDRERKRLKHAHLSSRHQKRCFKKGYHTGYDNAAADLNKDKGSDNPYEAGSNEYEYYSDGCMAGKKDGSANMSSVYQRYDYQYDSRFEESFRNGYETCWSKYR